MFFKHRNFVRVYINDIVIFSNTPEKYIRHLKIVLKIIDENRLNISAAKSFVGYLYVRLLRLIVNGTGRSRTDDRIAVFKKIQFPDIFDFLSIYFGMAGYLRLNILWFDIKA